MLDRVEVKVKLAEGAVLPSYETSGAAGMDLRAYIPDEQPLIVPAGMRALVSTGLSVAIPMGYELQVRPRSGLALKKGVTVANSPGCVDSDYRGVIGVIIINHGDSDFVINNGDRIAQAILSPVSVAIFNNVDELDSTERGAGGFGSTGTK